MAARRLIVNADDFGISPGVNRGVLEAHRRGIVTSASLMSNQPCAAQAIEQWRETSTLGLGLHVTLTAGSPCLPPEQVPTLVDRQGHFRSLLAWLTGAGWWRVRPDEVQHEIAAQVEQALALGARIEHLDSHHHVHIVPRVGRALIRIARDYGISWVRCPTESPRWAAPRDLARARAVSLLAGWLRRALRRAGLRTSDRFLGVALGYGYDTEALVAELGRVGPGRTELMTHPGYPDAELARVTSYTAGRDRELVSLIDPRVRGSIAARGIELNRWHDN